MQLMTPKKYMLYECISAMQKAIRRGDAKMAGYWACEIWRGGFDRYVWRRLLIISAEDCFGIITKEVMALNDAYLVINGYQRGAGGGQLFVCKAAYLLALAEKSRDVDNLINAVLMDGMGITDEEIAADIAAAEAADAPRLEVPWEAYDYHSARGKKAGKTRESFMADEQAALKPLRPGLFDHLVTKEALDANAPLREQRRAEEAAQQKLKLNAGHIPDAKEPK
jgi:replication-associated recombination protein RarA